MLTGEGGICDTDSSALQKYVLRVQLRHTQMHTGIERCACAPCPSHYTSSPQPLAGQCLVCLICLRFCVSHNMYVLYRRIRVPLQDSIDGAERVDIHASANLRLRYLGQPKMMRALKTQAYSTPLQRTTSHSVAHSVCFAFVFGDQIRYFGLRGTALSGTPRGSTFGALHNLAMSTLFLS